MPIKPKQWFPVLHLVTGAPDRNELNANVTLSQIICNWIYKPEIFLKVYFNFKEFKNFPVSSFNCGHTNSSYKKSTSCIKEFFFKLVLTMCALL